MPVPRKIGVGRASRWTDEHRKALLGHDFFGAFAGFRTGPFRDHPGLAVDYRCREDEQERIHERRKAAWNDLRDELLATWIAERPFCRPPAWWEFDAPEKRQCINGPHPHDTPEYKAHVEETDRQYPGFAKRSAKLWYGCPNLIGGPGFNRTPHPEYETERDYLIRLDLLTDLERELLANEQITTASPRAKVNADSN